MPRIASQIPVDYIGGDALLAFGNGYYLLAQFGDRGYFPYRYCRDRAAADKAFNGAAVLYDERMLVRYRGGTHCEVLRSSEL